MLIEMMKLGNKTVSAVYLGATRVWRYVFTRTEQTCADWEDPFKHPNVIDVNTSYLSKNPS